MAGKRIDLTGQRFGMLTARACVGRRDHKALWQCKCDCGNMTYVVSSVLRAGKTRSCGCLARNNGAGNRTHGKSRTKLYHIFHAMHQRCYNPKFKFYDYYGGRGIKICQEWHDLDTFWDWAMSHGYKDGLSIERKDVDGDYSPDNCCWITMDRQHRNCRNTLFVEWQGEMVRVTDLAKEYGKPYDTLKYRIKAGWTLEEALTRPVKKKAAPRCGRPRDGKEKMMVASV